MKGRRPTNFVCVCIFFSHASEPNEFKAAFQEALHKSRTCGLKMEGRVDVAVNVLAITKEHFRRRCFDGRPILDSFSVPWN